MYCTVMRIAQKGTVQGGLTEKAAKSERRKLTQRLQLLIFSILCIKYAGLLVPSMPLEDREDNKLIKKIKLTKKNDPQKNN